MSLRFLTAPSYRLKLTLLILLVLMSGTLIVARWKSGTNSGAEIQGARNDAVEAEVITATPIGFEPSEIMRPQGRFLLAVDNQSGLDELNLYLERETGERLNVALSRRGKLKWREILDLPPGRYILRAAHDQSWRCNINLTPR